MLAQFGFGVLIITFLLALFQRKRKHFRLFREIRSVGGKLAAGLAIDFPAFACPPEHFICW